MARRKTPAAKAAAVPLPRLPDAAEERSAALRALALEIIARYSTATALALASWIDEVADKLVKIGARRIDRLRGPPMAVA